MSSYFSLQVFSNGVVVYEVEENAVTIVDACRRNLVCTHLLGNILLLFER